MRLSVRGYLRVLRVAARTLDDLDGSDDPTRLDGCT